MACHINYELFTLAQLRNTARSSPQLSPCLPDSYVRNYHKDKYVNGPPKSQCPFYVNPLTPNRCPYGMYQVQLKWESYHLNSHTILRK